MIQKITLLLFIFVLFAAAVFAQANINGALGGRVIDANEAAIGGASVSLTNTETGREFSAATDEAGNYSFPPLAPGVYRLTVEKQNFKRAARGNVVVTFNQTATANAVGGNIAAR